MTAIVLHNPHSGPRGAATPDAIRHAIATAGINPHYRPVPRGKLLPEEARRAIAEAPDVLVAAGGDGTVSATAAALVTCNPRIPLAILPTGTLNHFAKDLGIPPTLPEAAQVVASNHRTEVDIAQVTAADNTTHYFINNASLGLYPRMVHRRQDHLRLGYGKFLATLFASWRTFWKHSTLRVRLLIDDVPEDHDTPVVFVGNNAYQMSLLSIGNRPCLTDGYLSLYLVTRTGRFALLSLALRALLGSLDQSKDFFSTCLPTFTLDSPKHKSLSIALDGEPLHLPPPLTFTSLPKALNVITPKPI